MTGTFPHTRLRRLRYEANIRELVRNVNLTSQQLILPLFIRHGQNIKKPISSMPGHFQWSIDRLSEELREIDQLGIRNILLFGIPQHKDALGEEAYCEQGIIPTAIRQIKKTHPHFLVITDVCFCEYTDHGHCGILNENQVVDNDATLPLLVKQAIQHAKAGADMIAPSGMIDGMVYHLRQGLDAAGFSELPILSYAVKYASHLYGPFRDAAEGTPQFGDRRTHQLDFAEKEQALRECELDIAEGADMLMVKPAHTYLDIVHAVKQKYPAIPLAAYHTSGEYALLKAATEKGWIDEKHAVREVLTAIRRAGADLIITYYAKEMAKWQQSI